MECGAEHPTGYLPALRLLVSCHSGSSHASRESNISLGWEVSMVVPPGVARVTESIDQSADGRHRGMKQGACEIDLRRKIVIIMSVEV